MHVCKMKISSYSIILSVSSILSLAQSSHASPQFLSNGISMILQENHEKAQIHPYHLGARKVKVKHDLGAPREYQS